MSVFSMNLATIITTASVVTVPGTGKGSIVGARLSAGAASTLSIYNGTTAAAARVARLQAGGAGADELSIPVRIDGTVKVQLSTTASSTVAFVYLV